MWDPTQDAWAAGFIDGEGSFVITTTGATIAGRRLALAPRFTLGLRADEARILRALCDAFGGSLSFSAASRGSKPRGTWTVCSRADLRRLCGYLDAYPLRAKKAADYAIWREAVALYEGAELAVAVLEQMTALRAALVAGRVYAGESHRRVRSHVTVRVA